ncbi:MAG: efflux transporter outer membrane subunit [Rikenellaceae bacterium]
MRKIRLYIAVSIALLSLWRCAPKLLTSDLEPPQSWIFGESIDVDTLQLPIKWWEIFGDTTLNNLIQRALLNNRDLAAAATKVESAQANIKVLKSEYLPALSLVAYGENEYTYTDKNVQEYYLEPTISWEVSLFGALRQSSKKAKAEYASSEWALRAMRLSIAAEIANVYFTLQQAMSNLVIAQSTYDLRLSEAALIDSMYQYGMSDGVAREQAQSLKYSALSDISLYTRVAEQTKMTLSVLLGETPNDVYGRVSPDVPHEIVAGVLPPKIPMLMPSELLERRPDVIESYYNMESAAAKVGIARANRYPSLSITAEGGVLGSTLKSLTSSHPWAWTVIGEVVQPIFNFGRLKNSERIAVQSYMESLYTYEDTMLTAFSEVESALIAIETYATQREAAAALVGTNADIANKVNALYDNGMNDYLNVIDAERELYSAQMGLVAAITEQYVSYISLFKALGGGY